MHIQPGLRFLLCGNRCFCLLLYRLLLHPRIFAECVEECQSMQFPIKSSFSHALGSKLCMDFPVLTAVCCVFVRIDPKLLLCFFCLIASVFFVFFIRQCYPDVVFCFFNLHGFYCRMIFYDFFIGRRVIFPIYGDMREFLFSISLTFRLHLRRRRPLPGLSHALGKEPLHLIQGLHALPQHLRRGGNSLRKEHKSGREDFHPPSHTTVRAVRHTAVRLSISY